MGRNNNNYLILPQKIGFYKLYLKSFNFLVIKGYIGKICVVLKPTFLVKNKQLFFFFKKSLTKEKKKNVIGLLYLFLLGLLKNVQFGFKSIIKINGIGCTFFLKEKFLCLEVGLSHVIFYKIPKTIILWILGKKLNYLKVYGILSFYVNDCLAKLILLRFPNIYTGKGIFWNNTKIFLKIGKIKKA
jgi:ribosomal protein L6P/L9E